VLRRIFASKREKITGGWRKSHREELQKVVHFAIYDFGNQIQEDEMGDAL
jgi:hypothetical protein